MENILWVAGTLVVLVAAGFGYARVRSALLRRGTRPVASDADRAAAERRGESADLGLRVEQQRIENDAAARASLQARPPV